MHEFSDTELYLRIRKSSHLAFQEFYNRHWNRLFLYAYKIIETQSASEDIVQEIFIELWVNRKTRSIDNITAYISKAVKIKSFNILRNSAITEKHLKLFGQPLIEKNTEESIEYTETREKIETLISTLPNRCEEIFRMSRFDNMSNLEISKKLNISVQTVKNQISKAISLIKPNI
nr:RNA polymerase sigma-70 factor [Bacteroidota bacterium]